MPAKRHTATRACFLEGLMDHREIEVINKKVSLLFPFFLVLFEMAVYMSSHAYLPALPVVQKEFVISQDGAMYTISVWFCATWVLGLFLGSVANSFGRRPMLLFGSLTFCIGTLICMSTSDYRMFLCGRFLEGLAMVPIYIAGYASVHKLYDTRMSIRVITVMLAVALLAPGFGTLFGAWCMMAYGWRMVFFFILLMGCASMIGLWYKMPESLQEKSPVNLVSTMKGYLDIMRDRTFFCTLTSIGLLYSILVMWVVELPFIISDTLNLPASYYGWVQAIVFSNMAIFSGVANYLYKRCRISHVVDIGYVILVVGILLFIISSIYMWSWWYCVQAMIVVLVGYVFILGALNRLAMEIPSKESLGCKSALLVVVRGLYGFAGSYVIALLNNKTFLSLSLPMVCVTVLLLLFHKRQYHEMRLFFAQCS